MEQEGFLGSQEDSKDPHVQYDGTTEAATTQDGSQVSIVTHVQILEPDDTTQAVDEAGAVDEGFDAEFDNASEFRSAYIERQREGRPLAVAGGSIVVIIFSFCFAVLLTAIVAGIFWRVIFSLYDHDPELFVVAINSFGSSFFSGAALGATGIVAALKLMPMLIDQVSGYFAGKQKDPPTEE